VRAKQRVLSAGRFTNASLTFRKSTIPGVNIKTADFNASNENIPIFRKIVKPAEKEELSRLRTAQDLKERVLGA
jgi:hypothetical protein